MDITAAHGPSWVKLDPGQCDTLWHKLEPLVETVLQRTDGELLAEDVHMMLINSGMHAFIVYEDQQMHALCVVQLVAELRTRVCRIVLLTGADMDHWVHFEAVIENWAKAMNCDYIDAFTRPGMVKKMMPYGYYPKYQVIRKYIRKEVH